MKLRGVSGLWWSSRQRCWDCLSIVQFVWMSDRKPVVVDIELCHVKCFRKQNQNQVFSWIVWIVSDLMSCCQMSINWDSRISHSVIIVSDVNCFKCQHSRIRIRSISILEIVNCFYASWIGLLTCHLFQNVSDWSQIWNVKLFENQT